MIIKALNSEDSLKKFTVFSFNHGSREDCLLLIATATLMLQSQQFKPEALLHAVIEEATEDLYRLENSN